MNNEITVIEQEVNSWIDLVTDKEELKKFEGYKKLLNKPAPVKWLKKHPIATKKIKDSSGTIKEVAAEYLPIDKVEWFLDSIFLQWRVEVLREGVMFQSIYVTIRLHYIHPVTKEWSYHDGVGAKSCQKDKGLDFSASSIKDSAVMMALPSAKAFAIKDAADHIGKIFGRDVNRDGAIEYGTAYQEKKDQQKPPEEDRLIKLLEACKTREELSVHKVHCVSEAQTLVFKQLWTKLK